MRVHTKAMGWKWTEGDGYKIMQEMESPGIVVNREEVIKNDNEVRFLAQVNG